MDRAAGQHRYAWQGPRLARAPVLAHNSRMSPRGVHDMGGLPAGSIDRTEHDVSHWEMEVDALLVLLANLDPPLVRTDELRRGIESLGEEAYNSLGYYERWIASIAANLVEKGVLTQHEIERRVADIRARTKDET